MPAIRAGRKLWICAYFAPLNEMNWPTMLFVAPVFAIRRFAMPMIGTDLNLWLDFHCQLRRHVAAVVDIAISIDP